MSARPAYDQIIQGLSGIMSVTGAEDTAPLRAGFPVSDAIAGLNAALALAAALAGAARSGAGSTIDVSMLDSTIATAAWVVSNYLITGQEPKPMGNENWTASPSGTFRTADGLLNIAANKQAHWESVAKALELTPLLQDPRFMEREERKRNRDALKTLMEEVLTTRSAAEWEEVFSSCGVPAGRVLSIPEAIGQEQLRDRRLFRTFDEVPGVGRPVTVTDSGFLIEEEGRVELSPPARLGEHNAEILGELGVDAAGLVALREENAI